MAELAGALLLAGLVSFAIGGLLPPPRVFTGPPEEQMAVVGQHPGRWAGSALGIGVAVVVTLAGLALLALILGEAGAQNLPILGLVAFGLGAVFFIVELTFRATVMVSAATAPGGVPGWFEPLRAWAGAAYWVYMLLAYLGLAGFGGAILQTSVPGVTFGWAALVFGLSGAVVYVSRFPQRLWTVFDVPGLLYLVTGAIGVGLLLRS